MNLKCKSNKNYFLKILLILLAGFIFSLLFFFNSSYAIEEIPLENIVQAKSNKNNTKKTIDYGYKTNHWVNVRSGAGINNSQIGRLDAGKELKTQGIVKNGYLRIEYNGRVAYISNEFVKKFKKENTEVKTKVPETKAAEIKNPETKKPEKDSDKEIFSLEMQSLRESQKKEAKSLKEHIGILPAVGNNIIEKIFAIICISSIMVIHILVYKRN